MRFVHELWTEVHGVGPDGDDSYDLDLHGFLNRLRTSSFRFPKARTLVVVQGQRLPMDFYRLLRLLDLPMIVFIDPTDRIDETGTTADELVHLLDVREPDLLASVDSTTPIHDLISQYDGGPTRFRGVRPDRPGELPVLMRHATLKEEALHAAEYAAEFPRTVVGLLVPDTKLLQRFLTELRAGSTSTYQWFRGGVEIPHGQQVDVTAPGLKLLTWISARGLKFDRVILPALQYVTDSQLTDAMHGVAATARHSLVLSYSGQGEPRVLSKLPRQLMDDQTATSVRAVTTPLDDREPMRRPVVERADMPVVHVRQRTAIDAARDVLREDRVDTAHRRRVLTAEEEVGLAQLMRAQDIGLDVELPKRYRATLAAGDVRARAFDAFVNHNDGLVRSIAGRYSAQAFDFDDLYQYGVIGLIRAVEKFDATAGTKFSTYATHWIKQSISRAIPDEGLLIRIPVHAYEMFLKIERTRNEILRLGRRASVSEISARTEIEPAKVVELLRQGAGVLSLELPAGADTDVTLAELMDMADFTSDPDTVFDREAVAQLVSSALAILDQRGAEVLRLRFGFDGGEEQTLEQIGDRYAVTRERIRQIEKKNKSRLADILRSTGVTGSSAFEPVTPVSSKPVRQCPRPSHLRRQAPPRPHSTNILARGTKLHHRLGVTATHPSLAVVVTALVDRAITAGARSISLLSDSALTPKWLALIHNGSPFLEQSLRATLATTDDEDRPARTLVGAVMRLFDELMVWEKATYPEHGVVLTHSPDTSLWWLRQQTAPLAPDLAALEAGDNSVVILHVPSAGVHRATIDTALSATVTSLGVIFGELLRAKVLAVTVNGRAVRGLDPFLWENTRAQDLGTEVVHADGLTVRINPRVLPHPDALRDQDLAAVGSPDDWNRTQGFYIRCAGRYLSCAGWLDLPGLDSTPKTALARVAVEIREDERAAWGEDGVSLSPPEPLRPRLIALAQLARRRSEAVVAHRQKDPT
jgi:RNA polymerase sigma factor (sigma-70 family)